MQVQIDPLVLVLDLEQLLLRSPEELLPLLENHILLIIMGQLRDIKERERLSRGLCRDYNKLFAENDILVFPHPLSTKQTDARLLAPRKLAHLVGITTSAMTPDRPTETPVAGAAARQATPSTVRSRLARFLRFALLLLAVLVPVVGMSQIWSRSTVAQGLRTASVLASGRSVSSQHWSPPTTGLVERARRKETDRSVVGIWVVDSSLAAGRSAWTRERNVAKSPSRIFVERPRSRELRALAGSSTIRPESFESHPRLGSGQSQVSSEFAAATRFRYKIVGAEHSRDAPGFQHRYWRRVPSPATKDRQRQSRAQRSKSAFS